MRHQQDLLGTFANHKVAANLLMIIMLLVGVMALNKHNVQFFPTFELDIISVNTIWTGASAEDVERAITIPLEQRLRTIDHLKEITSSSAPSVSGITIEFDEDVDITEALEQVKKQVEDFNSLPEDAEDPKVVQTVRYESVARVLIQGVNDMDELRTLARQFENDLLNRGIDKIDLIGLPKETMRIEVASEQMQRTGLSLSELGQTINNISQDLPAGLLGEDDGTRELRSLNKGRTPASFEQISIVSQADQHLLLGDIATITRTTIDNSTSITVNDELAAVLVLNRSETGDSLESAEILQQWMDEVVPTLPPNIKVTVFNERWQLIKQRIMLLVKNGAGGLALVLLILYLFLSSRVAFWVAVGIPVSFMATLAVLYVAGGSINMISLFALIMALGIIVDDAIVVGEDAQSHFDMGEDPLKAAEGGARRMLSPVMASSLTTIAAFLPLMLVGGRMGNIMMSIPLVIISVIIASLIESFYILPGHLKNAFVNAKRNQTSGLRYRLDQGFDYFKNRMFRPLVVLSLEFRYATIALALAMLILSIGLFAGARIGWQFFPSPESTTVNANVRFVAGTASTKVDTFLNYLEDTLKQTISESDEKIVDMYYVLHGSSSGRGRAIEGARIGSIYVELLPSDSRKTDNRTFIKNWRDKVETPAGIESFTISSRRVGPSSRDIDVKLKGGDAETLKQASFELQEALKGIDGVSAIDDDLPFGREQLIYDLSEEGKALGLTIKNLGQQLRHAYDGVSIQRFQDGADEVEVRLQLPESEQNSITSLEMLPIKLPSGEFITLSSVAHWDSRQGFEALRHTNGDLTVSVTANVNAAVNNTQEITDDLIQNTLPDISNRYGVSFDLGGRAQSQQETMTDLKIGVGVAFLLMYLVLAWVFSSYGWPFLVMMTIPLGLTGAILGHYAMGMNMTILSLFGFFGLSGIVVNDTIILVTFYKHIREKGMAIKEALVEAACQRLRAVLLTSMTTVAGLTPLLFETSRQAQFLIPMATSIAFGLAFATLLILFVIPSLLSIYEDVHEKLHGKNVHLPESQVQSA